MRRAPLLPSGETAAERIAGAGGKESGAALQSAASAAGSARETPRSVREPGGPLCASEKRVFPTRERPLVAVRTLLDTVTTTRGVWAAALLCKRSCNLAKNTAAAFVRAARRWKQAVNVLVSEVCKRLRAELGWEGLQALMGIKVLCMHCLIV